MATVTQFLSMNRGLVSPLFSLSGVTAHASPSDCPPAQRPLSSIRALTRDVNDSYARPGRVVLAVFVWPWSPISIASCKRVCEASLRPYSASKNTQSQNGDDLKAKNSTQATDAELCVHVVDGSEPDARALAEGYLVVAGVPSVVAWRGGCVVSIARKGAQGSAKRLAGALTIDQAEDLIRNLIEAPQGAQSIEVQF
jgi:hypothetical protein